MAWPQSTGLHGGRCWGCGSIEGKENTGEWSQYRVLAEKILGTQENECRSAVPERERREETRRGGDGMPQTLTAGVRYKCIRSPSASQKTLAYITPVLKRALLCPWPLTKRNVLLAGLLEDSLDHARPAAAVILSCPYPPPSISWQKPTGR